MRHRATNELKQQCRCPGSPQKAVGRGQPTCPVPAPVSESDHREGPQGPSHKAFRTPPPSPTETRGGARWCTVQGWSPRPRLLPCPLLWILPFRDTEPGRPCGSVLPSPCQSPCLGHSQDHLRLIRESSCCRCSWTPNGMVGEHIL